MAKRHEWIATQSVNEVEMFVQESNKNAIRFYEYLGYKTIRGGMKLNLDRSCT